MVSYKVAGLGPQGHLREQPPSCHWTDAAKLPLAPPSVPETVPLVHSRSTASTIITEALLHMADPQPALLADSRGTNHGTVTDPLLEAPESKAVPQLYGSTAVQYSNTEPLISRPSAYPASSSVQLTALLHAVEQKPVPPPLDAAAAWNAPMLGEGQFTNSANMQTGFGLEVWDVADGPENDFVASCIEDPAGDDLGPVGDGAALLSLPLGSLSAP